MDLDFSLLTFSPSSRKTTKSSNLNRKCSKLAVKNKQINSTVNKEDPISSKQCRLPNSKINTTETTKNDFIAKNSVDHFSGNCDKTVGKQRINKGKENRYDVCDSVTSEWKEPAVTKGSRKSRCGLSIEHSNEKADAKKKRLMEVAPVHPTCTADDRLRSPVSETFSKSEITSEQVTTAFTSISNSSMKQEPPVPPLKLIEGAKENKFDGDNSDSIAPSSGSVIVISDTSSVSSDIIDCPTKKRTKSGKCRKNISLRKNITVIVETSDSEADVIGKSAEVSLGLHSSTRTPIMINSKTCVNKNTSLRKGTTIVLESSESEIDDEEKYIENSIKLNSKSPLFSGSKTLTRTRSRTERFFPRMNSTPLSLPVCEEPLGRSKYKDIENWLAKIPVNSSLSDVSNSSNILGKESESKSSVSNEYLSTSTEETLKKLYGPDFQFRTKKAQTSPRNRKKLTSLNPQTECIRKGQRKSRSFNSTRSEDFENFLRSVRKNVQTSNKKNNIIATPDFIDDEVESDSIIFCQDILNSRKDKTNKSPINRPKVTTNRRLIYSTDSGTPSPNADKSNCGTLKAKTIKKKDKVQKTPKVISSPIKHIRTPSTNKRKALTSRRLSIRASGLNFLTSLSSSATGPIHADGEFYRKNFKKNKEELCSKLFKLYNSQVFEDKLPANLSIEWNVRMKKTAGFCYNRRVLQSPGCKIRTSRIVLSTKVCDTAERLRDTLIHELCHAATWIVDDVKDGHGPHWKAWARKAVTIFPELPPIKRCHDYKIQTKFTYRCTVCGYSIGRHSKSLDLATKRCGHCYGMFELLVNTRRNSGTVVQQTIKKRSPVGFARFVKENYHSIKTSQTSLKHGEVMRLLGLQFSAVKIGAKKQGS